MACWMMDSFLFMVNIIKPMVQPSAIMLAMNKKNERFQAILDVMNDPNGYTNSYLAISSDYQRHAKLICAQYNLTTLDDQDERAKLLKDLLGTCHPLTFIEPSFHCDYGFNIHTHGLTVINYNVVILDTSKVDLGENCFIAPGCVLACSGHSLDPIQRGEGIGTSKPITIGKNVWIGANCTICGGVTIGDNVVIGAGSVVTRSIPDNVVAYGNPCKVHRAINEKDKLPITFTGQTK